MRGDTHTLTLAFVTRAFYEARVTFDPPSFSETTVRAGFVANPPGTHSSRTLMLAEVQTLFTTLGQWASQDEYRAAVIEDNVLGKSTVTTRRQTFRFLRELYGLAPELPMFRALRAYWAVDRKGQPLLALLSALAREPLLRAATPSILASREGAAFSAPRLSAAVDAAFPHRYHGTTLARIGRNLASSWTQSGHLSGRAAKVRARASSTPITVAYALHLGHLTGLRGDALFRSIWTAVLDLPEYELRAMAISASQQGWIEYRSASGVTEIGFHFLDSDRE